MEVKEVVVGKTRYVVCHNAEQARKDEADRKAIVESLKDKLKGSDKVLIGGKGYRKYLKTSEGKRFEIDIDKIAGEARYDGKWVLQTDLDVSAKEVALKYKDLWMVETFFRSLESIMENRPIYSGIRFRVAVLRPRNTCQSRQIRAAWPGLFMLFCGPVVSCVFAAGGVS